MVPAVCSSLPRRSAVSGPMSRIISSGRTSWTLRTFEGLELADQQRARARDLRELADAMRRRLGAVRRAERVHDVDIAQRGHLLREIFLVLLLALVEAHVLEQHGRAGRRIHAREPVF